jgi:hypothetical protein
VAADGATSVLLAQPDLLAAHGLESLTYPPL